MASINLSYIPVKKATVPPETPGTTLAAPIAAPFKNKIMSPNVLGTQKHALLKNNHQPMNYKREKFLLI